MSSTRYAVRHTSQIKRDLRLMAKQGKDLSVFEAVVEKLANGKPLELSNKDHALSGEYKGCRECHIRPDWLLLYEVDNNTLYLHLIRTGSHSELLAK